jgi:choline dehydrogenase
VFELTIICSDHYEEDVLVPEDVGDDLNTSYDWNVFTVPQVFLDGLSRLYDMGRVLGGGSILNGMCWQRGASQDFDAWVTLGNTGWAWEDLLSYFKKVNMKSDGTLSMIGLHK